ncbi:MAG: hypothetical protein Q8Q89_02915 [bacterium]|nr:hypothetical protein [bacterium]
MPNQDLQNYISQSRQAGKTDDQIRQELLGAGWPVQDIEEAFGGKITSDSQPTQKSRFLLVFYGFLVGFVIEIIYLFITFKTLGNFTLNFLIFPIIFLIFRFLPKNAYFRKGLALSIISAAVLIFLILLYRLDLINF